MPVRRAKFLLPATARLRCGSKVEMSPSGYPFDSASRDTTSVVGRVPSPAAGFPGRPAERRTRASAAVQGDRPTSCSQQPKLSQRDTHYTPIYGYGEVDVYPTFIQLELDS